MQPYFKSKKSHTKKHNKKRHRANHTKDIKIHDSIQETQPKQSIIIRMNNGILSATKTIIAGITAMLPQITVANSLSEPNTSSTAIQPLQNATQEINTTTDSSNIAAIQKTLNSTQRIVMDYLSDHYNDMQESEVRNPALDEEYYDNYDIAKQVTEGAEANASNNIGPVSTTAIIVPIVFISVAAATILFTYLSYKNDNKKTQTKNNRKEPNALTEEEGKCLFETKETSSANKSNKTIDSKLTQQKDKIEDNISSISETINETDKAKKSEKSNEEIDNETNEARIPGYSIGLTSLYPAKIMADKYFAPKK